VSDQIAVDASVSGAWVLDDERTGASEWLLDRVLRGAVHLVVPCLWCYEMANLLRTAAVRKRISERDALRALLVVHNLPLEIVHPKPQNESAILVAALELGLTAYDAAYVNLAESRDIDLVTADRDLLGLQARFPWIRALDEFVRNAGHASRGGR